MPLEIDFMKETIIKEGQGKMFWHWNVRALEFLNHYLNQVMSVGNKLGKKLRKKLEGDPRQRTFGGVMVGSFWTITAAERESAEPYKLHGLSIGLASKMLQDSAGNRMAAAWTLIKPSVPCGSLGIV